MILIILIFSIPSFSLQPFIENCLKHAGLNEKDNGQIIISTKKKTNKLSLVSMIMDVDLIFLKYQISQME